VPFARADEGTVKETQISAEPQLQAQAEQFSKEVVQQKQKALEAIEFLFGYGWGPLVGQKGYRLYPLAVSFDFNLKGLTEKIGFNPPQLLQFAIEPYASYIVNPHANIETGMSFAFKVGILPQTAKLQPYLKAGAGMSYMSMHSREQGTQFNFIEYGGLGVHYFFKKNTALTLEGRFRHLSNSGIDDPNHGINTYFVNIGLSQNF
jgi:hypothetical protein